jgi:flagella basal body P-ring formation protein FlgA
MRVLYQTRKEALLPHKWRGCFLGLLWFPVVALSAPTPGLPLLKTAELTSALIAQISPLAAQLQSQSGWQHMQVNYDVWLPDSAQRLPACSQPLQFVGAEKQMRLWGKHYFRVTCSAPDGWTLRSRVNVSVSLPVWVASRDISKQRPITRSDLCLQRVQLESLSRGFSVEPELLMDYRSPRLIRAGQAVDKNSLLAPLLVRKGESVLIRAEQTELHVSMQGEALQDGVAGEMIRVRNRSSQKEIQAEVSTVRGEVVVHF